jgi:isomerase DpgB
MSEHFLEWFRLLCVNPFGHIQVQLMAETTLINIKTHFLTNDNCVLTEVEVDGSTLPSSHLAAELNGALDQAEDLGPKSVLLLHVAGTSDQPDVCHWPSATSTQVVNKWERALRRIERSNLFTITLVDGACSWLALELLLLADRRLATETASIQPPAVASEIWPSMALYRLAKQIGESRARRVVMATKAVAAHDAAELDIVDEIAVDALDGLKRICNFVKQAPITDFAVRRRLLQDSLSTSFDEALGAHLAACDRSLRHSRSFSENQV